MVALLGGTDYFDACQRAWEKILGLEARAGVNLLGLKRDGKQKFGLKGKSITKAIFG